MYFENRILIKSFCGAPWGPDWTKIAHAQLDHEANNIRPYLDLYGI